VFLFVGVVSFILLDLKRSNYLNNSRKQNEGINLEKQDEQETLVANANNDQINGTIKNMNNSNQFEIVILHLCTFIIAFFLYGFLPGLQSYSTLPYDINTFYLSINLSNFSQPFAVFITIWSNKVSSLQLFIEFTLGLLCSIYIIILSVLSPCPFLLGELVLWLGSTLSIISWIGMSCFFTRLRCLVATKLSLLGKNMLLTFGITTLIGQMIGGILIFLLVDIYKVFKEKPNCIINDYC
jgi:hypothetical protein